jgi:hypothetical protein
MMMKPHWHALSEKYMGGDSLIMALIEGWAIRRLIAEEVVRRRGGQVMVYHLELERDTEMLEIALVDNPYVTSLMAQLIQQHTIVQPA